MATLRGYRLIGVAWAVLALLACGTESSAQSPAQNATALATDAAAVVDANSQSAVDLFSRIAAEFGSANIFVSPYSISTVLAMTYSGSRNRTRSQMASVLHFNFSDQALLEGYSGLQLQMGAATGQGNSGHDYKLEIANALWGEKDYRFLPEFVGGIDKYYGGGFHAVDFAHDPEGSRRQINQSVSSATDGHIPQLLASGDVDGLTRLVLTNAIYFKGNWAEKFSKDWTQSAPFTLTGGQTVAVPMMEQIDYFPYVHLDGVTAVELPYAGNELSMIVILPDVHGGKTDLNLSLETIQKIRKGMQLQFLGKVHLFLPRFRLETRYALKQTLSQMGMSDAFDKNVADLSGMDGARDLYIAQVIHQAMIEVNEEGSEAAAATAATTFWATAKQDVVPEVIFRADRPFLFLIQHNATGAILFIGRVSNPAAQ